MDDPSLFILLYCLEHNIKVREFDLGFYEQIDEPKEYDLLKKQERAMALIKNFTASC